MLHPATTAHILQTFLADIPHAAEFLGVPERAIRRMCEDGSLQCLRYGQRCGGQILIFTSSLAEYAERLANDAFYQDKHFTKYIAVKKNSSSARRIV